LNNFLCCNNFLVNNQFGFRCGHSTSMALMSLHEYVTESINNQLIPISVFLDLSKCFDTWNHNILLKKLEHYGVRGIVLDLITNYLQYRTQYVSFNNFCSDLLPITCGVPQGSVLGPLLFLIYINDINRTSSLLKFILFADDTTILFSAKTLFDLITCINCELAKVSEWFKVNKLSLNVTKTNFMI